jgi:hypothetical protein
MPTSPWRQHALAILVALVICVGLTARGQAVQTEVPPSEPPVTEQPTVVPPTEVPTQEPTAVPTEEPTEVPTEQPTEEPTEEPTEVPTEQPTDVPATPTANAQPPAPPAATQPPEVREAEVICRQPGPAVATPSATPATTVDTGGWTLLSCTIDIDASGLDQVQVRGTSNAPGWRVILVEEDAPNTPGLLNASNNLVSFVPDPESPRVTFLLGYQRSCSALPSTRLTFEVTGSAGGAQRMAATAELEIEEAAVPLPGVAIDALWVDTERDPAPTSIRVTWTGAPDACPWNLVVTLLDTGEGAWDLVRLDGLDDATATITGPVISVVVPPGDSPDGDLVIVILPAGGDRTVAAVALEAFTWP